ncbi:MAG: hypothetical protein V1733_00670 [bacterium]
MWGGQIATGMVWALLVLHGPSLAQQLVWRDQGVVRNLKIPADPGRSLVRLRITQKIEYSLALSGILFVNWERERNANQLVLLQDLIYQWIAVNDRKFRVIQKFTHHLGVQYFFDSIARFHLDDNTLETRVEWKLRKNHGIFLSSCLSTRIFNAYTVTMNDSGYQVRSLNSSFLTPFTGIFSTGFQCKWPMFGSLNFGISSAKLTWIRDKSIYEAQQTEVCFGVPSTKKSLLEYGVSFQFLVDTDLVKWMHWNCDLLIFKNTDLPVDVSLKNQFGFRINRVLKVRLQTRVFYEEQVSRKVQIENMVSVGLSVSL